MHIRCPNCGRRGNLPDNWVPEAQSLRCRKCHANFPTPELARLAAERNVAPPFDAVPARPRTMEPTTRLTDGFFSAFDGEDRPPRRPGPGDSIYELTFTLRDVPGGAGTAWDLPREAPAAEAPSSDEMEALRPSAEAPDAHAPWPARILASSGPALLVGALAGIAIVLPSVAYLAWRLLRDVPAADLRAPILFAGLSCTVALLILAIPLTMLATSLAELVRVLRHAPPPPDRPAGLGPS